MTTRILAAILAALVMMASPAAALTAKARAAVLDRIADQIQKNYVYKDKAVAIAAEVRGWKTDREIAAITDENRLAGILTERLRRRDRHFAVFFMPAKAGAPAPAPDAAAMAESERRSNYGFDRVERLPGNVGYIQMSYFADFDTALTGDKTPPARKTGEAALTFVGGCDAVIFDLRKNGGGSPAMIDLLLSAFFGDKPVLLNRFYERRGDRTQDFTTLANYTGPRRPSVPLFVLISGRTGSAAEEFAYDVKTRKRAVVVGETSYGGANPGDNFDAGHGFSIFISTGAAVNPITGTNWEGVGVKPDIAVPASDALRRATSEALQRILADAKPGDRTEARWTLEQLRAQAAPPPAQKLQDFVGLYGKRTVVLKDGALFYSRPRALPHRLVALAADTFGLEDMPGLRIVFKRDASRRVESMTLMDTSGYAALFVRAARP